MDNALALAHLQHFPKNRKFTIAELPGTVHPSHIKWLNNRGLIAYCGKPKNGAHGYFWKVSKKSKKMLDDCKKSYPSPLKERIPKERKKYIYHEVDQVKRQYSKDLEEVETYLKNNPDAETFDVALECHMSDNQALRLMQKCRSRRISTPSEQKTSTETC